MSKPPFSARSLPELLRKHTNNAPIPIRSVRSDVPDELDAIITDLLHVRPDDRPRNALLVVKRLQTLLEDHAEVGDSPMVSETPERHHESDSLASDDYHLATNLQDNIDRAKAVKQETDFSPDVSPSPSLLGSFQRIGEDYSINAETPNAAPDSGESTNPKRVDRLAETVTLLSAAEQDKVLPVHGQNVRPVKDNSSPVATSPWSELSSVPSSPAVPPQQIADSTGQNDHTSALSPKITDHVPKTATRFTAVSAEKSFDPFEEHERSRLIFSLPTVWASLTLMIVGLTVYYLLQPVSPEVLFKRITSTIRTGESEDGYSHALLKSAQADIDHFLLMYPNHPSAGQVRSYRDELELSEHERRLERRAQSSSLRSLSPVERAYVEILAISPYASDQAIDKLRAFIAVYQTVSSSSEPHHRTSSPVDICVELAHRRLKKLERDTDESHTEQAEVLRQRLEKAADLEATDPIRAEEIRWGIVELYQNHRWAKELVEEAKRHLEE